MSGPMTKRTRHFSLKPESRKKSIPPHPAPVKFRLILQQEKPLHYMAEWAIKSCRYQQEVRARGVRACAVSVRKLTIQILRGPNCLS